MVGSATQFPPDGVLRVEASSAVHVGSAADDAAGLGSNNPPEVETYTGLGVKIGLRGGRGHKAQGKERAGEEDR